MKKIGKIDWFANRILYALYEPVGLVKRIIYWILCWLSKVTSLIWKKVNNNHREYDSLKKITEDLFLHYTPKDSYICSQDVSTLLCILPVSLFLNLATIVIGYPLKILYAPNIVCTILLVIILILSASLLSEYFFWRKDRHYAFISSFKKESLVKRVAWVVGTYASIVSLIVIDIKLLSYIDKVHK